VIDRLNKGAKSMSEPEEKKNETPESVADLPVSFEQADEIQAGAETKETSGTTRSFNSFPGFTGGVYVAAGDVN